MVNIQHKPTTDLAIPPGETLRENLEALHLSQADLARRMDRPLKTVNEIIQGKAQITPETAIQLEHVLDIPASFWNALEKQYREILAQLQAEEKLDAQIEPARAFPYGEMARLGWVASTRKWRERVRELLRFFAVTSLDLVEEVESAAFRVAKPKQTSPQALACWLRRGEIEAEGIETNPYDALRFRECIRNIRSLTQEDPESFGPRLRSLCSSAGVAVVFVPHLKQTYANGAARWIRPDRALIQLSIRNRYEDIFWFSFFHEAAHILKHGKRGVFIDLQDHRRDRLEREADVFAQETLIPRRSFGEFVTRGLFGATDVSGFAKRIGVSPAIVVGRLHYDKLIHYSQLTQLRRRFKWAMREE